MSIGSGIRGDIEDFKRGFNAEPVPMAPRYEIPLRIGVELLRVVLFGFILAQPGVPLVPWGEPASIAVALVAAAAAVATRFHRDSWWGIACFLVACGAMASAVWTEATSTSILLIGGAIASVVHLSFARAQVYGMVAAVTVIASAFAVFDIHPPVKVDELLFSGGTWTPDRSARDALLLAAFVFVAGMQNVMRSENERQRERARLAEEARDAAVSSERARIARELHDVVSHHVTAMTLQAEAAAATADAGALRAVAESGREALAELRRLLGVLRRSEGAGGQPPATDPQPQLGDLDALAARATNGIEVTVTRVGSPRDLPNGIELCAYRLVQEAITNSTKHSDARHVEARLTYDDSALVIDVTDDGTPLATARTAGGGHGLVGMRERVALLDGELAVGPRADGPGFRVVARLPLQG